MHAKLHTLQPTHSTPTSLLFARYVAGQISDPAWRQIMNILDATDTSNEERIALMNFISDACFDLGPDEVKVPQASEVHDFVTMTRAA